MNPYRVVVGLIIVLLLHSGCAAPALTQCRGSISIQVADTHQRNERPVAEEPGNRFIVVTFWDYPTVNDTRGDLILHKVVVAEGNHITVDFPLRMYWVVWTPALGTQHLAPSPGIIVFHEEYVAGWEIGDTTGGVCCGRPKAEHQFTVTLASDEQVSEQDHPYAYSTKEFLEELIARTDDLIRKMSSHKELTSNDTSMVLDKLKQMAEQHGIREPE